MVKDTVIEIELDPYPVLYTKIFYKISYIIRTNPYNYFISSRGDTIYLYCGSVGISSAESIRDFAIGI